MNQILEFSKDPFSDTFSDTISKDEIKKMDELNMEIFYNSPSLTNTLCDKSLSYFIQRIDFEKITHKHFSHNFTRVLIEHLNSDDPNKKLKNKINPNKQYGDTVLWFILCHYIEYTLRDRFIMENVLFDKNKNYSEYLNPDAQTKKSGDTYLHRALLSKTTFNILMPNPHIKEFKGNEPIDVLDRRVRGCPSLSNYIKEWDARQN